MVFGGALRVVARQCLTFTLCRLHHCWRGSLRGRKRGPQGTRRRRGGHCCVAIDAKCAEFIQQGAHRSHEWTAAPGYSFECCRGLHCNLWGNGRWGTAFNDTYEYGIESNSWRPVVCTVPFRRRDTATRHALFTGGDARCGTRATVMLTYGGVSAPVQNLCSARIFRLAPRVADLGSTQDYAPLPDSKIRTFYCNHSSPAMGPRGLR